MAIDPDNVKAMIEWPTSINIRDLQGFLRLTGYYSRFVAGYARIALPLTKQMKKDRFGWNLEAEQAFQKLKEAISRARCWQC